MVSVKIKPIGQFAPLPDMAKILKEEMAKERKAVLRDFQITVRTWARQPDFEVTEGSDSIEVSTSNKIYGYVSDGTRPHVIRPKKAKALRFFGSGFVAKTVPNRLQPRAGRKANSNLRYALEVHHPGFAGRNFEKLIREKSQERLIANLDKAFLKALQKG